MRIPSAEPRFGRLSAALVYVLATLTLAGLPTGDLRQLYRSWIDRLTALESASITGSLPPIERAEIYRDALRAIHRLDAEIADLHNQIKLIEERLERRVTDLQRRFHALPARVSALRTGAARLTCST